MSELGQAVGRAMLKEMACCWLLCLLSVQEFLGSQAPKSLQAALSSSPCHLGLAFRLPVSGSRDLGCPPGPLCHLVTTGRLTPLPDPPWFLMDSQRRAEERGQFLPHQPGQ